MDGLSVRTALADRASNSTCSGVAEKNILDMNGTTIFVARPNLILSRPRQALFGYEGSSCYLHSLIPVQALLL